MDTHAFLWFIEGDNNLSDSARYFIENNQYQKRLSIASLWEMSIKASLNRLELKTNFPNLIQNYVYGNGFNILSINADHLEQLKTLPYYHKDPFDRLIIAQGLAENIPILTKDELFKQYTKNLLW
jgi:PIN domain nuclease of toxin-antitoxin system